MLHALLHGKLDPSTPQPQRREDALTSTVFGTLVWMGAWETLARWLCPGRVDPNDLASHACECWFWPRLGGVEPDVILRLGDVLVVVEAKLRSRRHDRAATDDPEDLRPRDQLVRQYQCITTPPERRKAYSESIEQAIAQCRVMQAYVVDVRHLRRARSECEESREGLPKGASLETVTWQGLFRLITEAQIAVHRWAADLRAYLEFESLDAFQGVRRGVSAAPVIRPVASWCVRRSEMHFHDAAAEANRGPVALLLLWGRQTKAEAAARAYGLLALDQAVVSGLAARVVMNWCRVSQGGRYE